MDESPKTPERNAHAPTHEPEGGRGAEKPSMLEPAARPRQPAINLPPLLIAILALLIGLYLVETYLLDDDTRYLLLYELAFSPLRYVYPLSSQGLEWLWTPVTYSLLHGSAEHLAFNSLWLAAFGAPVLRRFGTWRFLAFWGSRPLPPLSSTHS